MVIHGLLGTPKTFGYEIANKLKILNISNLDIILPIVLHKGNCSLEIAAEPLYLLLLDYIKLNLFKPIHLVACSNGCRIASWIEIKLINVNVNIRLTCIAGAFNGSKMVDIFEIPLSLILDKNVLTALKTNSNINNM